MLISELSAAGRDLANRLGFADVVEPDQLPAALTELSGGLGADVVYECARIASLLQASAEQVRRGGVLALLGYPWRSPGSVMRTGRVANSPSSGPWPTTHEDFLGSIRAIAGRRLDVSALHTGTVGLTMLQGVLEELDSGASRHMKVLVDPRQVG